jgi:hypothetical protein
MAVELLHEQEEAEMVGCGFSNRHGESVSKGCAFGVAVSSYFALTGRSEGALLRSNVISRRRIMPEDDNALMGRDLLCYFQASKFWPRGK